MTKFQEIQLYVALAIVAGWMLYRPLAYAAALILYVAIGFLRMFRRFGIAAPIVAESTIRYVLPKPGDRICKK